MIKNKLPIVIVCLLGVGLIMIFTYAVRRSQWTASIQLTDRDIEANEQAQDHLRRGDVFYQDGQLDMAEAEYKLSYTIGGTSKIECGFKIVEVNEKLGRQGAALSLLDEMEKPNWSKADHARATKIRARLETYLYNKTVKAQSEGWENIRRGNSFDSAGRYEEAIQAYKKAYDVDPGNRIMTGKILIEAYERLSRYNEALIVVEDILKNQPLVEIGIKRFEEIRARLLAAKNKTYKPDDAPSETLEKH